MAGRPLAVRRGMGRVQPRRRQSVGAVSLPQSRATSLSAAIRAAFSTSAGLSVQVDPGSTGGGGNDDPSFRYVGPTATGNGSGSDWNNQAAWSTFAPQRGLTYYVRGGSYSARVFSTAPSNTTRITIKKATVADHGTDTGWSSAWGASVAAITGTMDFRTSYWTLDGTEGGGPGAWMSGHGISITQTGAASAMITLEQGSNLRGMEFKRLRLNGMNNRNTDGGSQGNDGIKSNNGAEFLVQRCHFWGIGRCPIWAPVCRTGGHTVELSCVESYWGNALQHSELAAIYGISGAIVVTYRNNLFLHMDGTGGIQWDNSGNRNAQLRVHGNIVYFRNLPGEEPWWESRNGIVGGWTGGGGEDWFNVRIHNNTFHTTNQSFVFPVVEIYRTGNIEAYNNVYVNTGNGKVSYQHVGVHNYNHAVNAPGGVTGEANGTSSATDPYNISATTDFTIKTGVTIPAGLDLGADYNVDMYGNVRQPGNWTKGAIQQV